MNTTTFTYSYWNNRYDRGGRSGPGSYGFVAHVKSEFLTSFVKKHAIKTMVEYGCGDGNNLCLTTEKNPNLKIIGVDISTTALDLCRRKMPEHVFVHKNDYVAAAEPVDLVVSLEVIFHLIEDEVYNDYMRSITSIGSEWLVILSPDQDERRQHAGAAHVKKRKYSNHPSLEERYDLVEEAGFGSDECFSSWKIFRRRAHQRNNNKDSP